MRQSRPALPTGVKRQISLNKDIFLVVEALLQANPKHPMTNDKLVEITGLDTHTIRGICSHLHNKTFLDDMDAEHLSNGKARGNKGWFIKARYYDYTKEIIQELKANDEVPTDLHKKAGKHKMYARLERRSKKWVDTGDRIGPYAVLFVNSCATKTVSVRYAKVADIQNINGYPTHIPICQEERLIKEGLL